MQNVIFEGVFGSHLYGTNTESSDFDYKQIFIPSAREIVLGKGKDIYNTARPKTVEGEKNLPGESETESFSLKKYLHLLAEGQTVALDMLFTPTDNMIRVTSLWHEIRVNKEKLLTKKAKVFLGYCQRQAKKYGIKGSRIADCRKTLDYLKRFDSFYKLKNLKDEIINFVIDANKSGSEFIKFTTIPNHIGISIDYLEVCDRKIQLTSTVKEGIDILQKLFDEYGKRALQAEQNEGIDWKALSHAVRVCEEAKELFQTGKITFPRPEASHLVEIKRGLLPYAPVANEIEELMEEVATLAPQANLRDEPDWEWIDNFVYDVYRKEILNGTS